MARIFDIADIPFAHVSEDEKKTYAAKMKETGSFQGYKPRQYWVGLFSIFNIKIGADRLRCCSST